MPGPSGIFNCYTLDQLTALKLDMLDRLKNGVFTSTSGAGKSGGRQYPAQSMAEVQQYLREINFSINILTGNNPIKRTNFVVSRREEFGGYDCNGH